MKRHILFEPGEFYHLYNRGVNRGKIFFDEENYFFFIRNFKRFLLPVMDIIAYCLMPTHYHLLICVIGSDFNTLATNAEEKQINSAVARAMQKFSISYTKAINKRYERVGSLFQGPYQVRYIRDVDHSRRIIPYIHENPVHVRLVNKATDWKYSSARVYEGIEKQGFINPLK